MLCFFSAFFGFFFFAPSHLIRTLHFLLLLLLPCLFHLPTGADLPGDKQDGLPLPVGAFWYSSFDTSQSKDKMASTANEVFTFVLLSRWTFFNLTPAN